MKGTIFAVLAASAIAVAMASPASAHVTATPVEGPAGGFFTTYFKVGHGCDDSPTTKVSVQIPEGVTSVAAEAKPGWEASTEIVQLEEPIEIEGEEVTETVGSVTWTASDAPLDPHQFTLFGLSMRLPEGAAGDVAYFPFVQTCEEGSNDWVTIPESLEEWHDVDEPAPYVVLAAAEGDHEAEAEEGSGQENAGMSESDVRGIASEVLASAEGDTGDESSSGVILGAIGAAAGLTALVIAALAYRRSRTP